MTEVVLALGSNLGDREQFLARARQRLADACAVTIEKASTVIETEPIGPEQPRYLNQVVAGETDLDPHELLERIKETERELGRTRCERWGPREIDIDILVLGGTRIHDETLTIPHQELVNRRFVLEPWAEIAPEFVVPGQRATVRELLEALDASQRKR